MRLLRQKLQSLNNMLFSTTAEVKDFYDVEKNMLFASLAPFIQDAEQQYILPVLGDAELLDLEAAYDDGSGSPDAEQLALINALRPALIKLALYNGFPTLNIRITDMGIMKSESSDYNPAPGADVYYARTQLLLDGYNALDQLYQFLEQNAGSYPLWTASSAFTQYTQFFIKNAAIFNQHANINGSRWLFSQFIQTMSSVEMLRISGFLQLNFFSYLKTQFIADALTSDETLLLFGDQTKGIPGLAKAIALYTYAEAAVDTNLREQMRIFMVTRPEQLARVENPWVEFKALAEDYIDKADAFMKQMETYLNATASLTVFNLWFTGPNYKDPTTHKQHAIEQYRNRDSKSTFAFL